MNNFFFQKRFCSEDEIDTGSTGDSEIQMDEIEEESSSADDEASSND